MKGCEYMLNSFPHAIYSNLIIKTNIPSQGFPITPILTLFLTKYTIDILIFALKLFSKKIKMKLKLSYSDFLDILASLEVTDLSINPNIDRI